MKRKNAWILTVMILFGVGCRLLMPTEAPVPATSEPICQPSRLLTVKDNGQSISLHTGDVFGIDLESNPSTGYEWLADKIDTGKLTEMGSDYIGGGNMPGSGGVQRLCFRVTGSGATNLRLIYRQPWNADATPGAYEFPDFEITLEIDG
jgi:predicted secreted protein